MEITQINGTKIDNHANLLVEVFSQAPWSESWEFKNAHDRLLCYKDAPYFLGLSAIHNNELIGFIFGNLEPYQKSSHFLLKEMCVKKENQRTGVGKKLINKLHQILKSREVDSVILLTRKKSPAEQFYMNKGYNLSETMGLYFKEIKT
ncbi:MAG: GNAT family N-acetyltransferase [Ectothiorhodospiraceae bacterium]|nr:GNAT family N-acetyltransferase [Ectothiorhodospiraceae bacterium]